jgi:hypothetical protein
MVVKTKIVVVSYIRVKRELQRIYRNGCRCNERLNTENEGETSVFISG